MSITAGTSIESLSARALASLGKLTLWMRDNTGPADGTLDMLREAVELLADAQRTLPSSTPRVRDLLRTQHAHSRGPWRVMHDAYIVDRFGNPVATVKTSDDAALIAKSPEMLGALQLAIFTEQDAWDSPFGSGKLYSEPQWMATARAIVADIRKHS